MYPCLQVIQGKNGSRVSKTLKGTSVMSGGQRFVSSPLLLQLSQLAAQASFCLLHSQWRKHHDNPHELSKREGRTGLGSVKDHNSLRVKRKRRRPAKTEFPSPAHRGDSHEEGTLVNGNVFLLGQAAAVPDAHGAKLLLP